MRLEFIDTLHEIAENDDRIWLLTGDLGYSVLERFATSYPERFINVGIAEQNMTGIAAGLALDNKIVFTYSIANFPVLRCLEQIRNDVCYHNVNVKIVAVGTGLTYASEGFTHHGLEDLAAMRSMPNMTVLAPSDPVETRLCTKAITKWPGPCYMRLGATVEQKIHEKEPVFEIGKAICLRNGNDIALISTGNMLHETLLAAEQLSPHIQASVFSMHTLKPIDRNAIMKMFSAKLIVTIEEHAKVGGLGSAVAEELAFYNNHPPLLALNTGNEIIHDIGSQAWLRETLGLSAKQIAHSVRAHYSLGSF